MESWNYYERAPTGAVGPGQGYQFSWLVKVLESFEGVARWFRLRPFAVEPVVRREQHKLSGLNRLLGSPEEVASVDALALKFASGVDANPHLSTLGRVLIRGSTAQDLAQRRKLLQYFEANEAFIEAGGPVRAPIIVAGAPRTGTTLLHRLLSLDPETRAPLNFEMFSPVPPMSAHADPSEDPRILKLENAMGKLSWFSPGALERLKASHPISPSMPEECLTRMMAWSGLGGINSFMAGRGFVEAVLGGDGFHWGPVIRLEKLFLKTLAAYRPVPSHWTLKAPSFALCLPYVFREFPDARVVITHRDPLVTLPSLCRLGESWCSLHDRPGHFDKVRFGSMMAGEFVHYLNDPKDFRGSNPGRERQIVDLSYESIMADPVGSIERTYRQFGLVFSSEHEQRIRDFLCRNPQGKHGRHAYSLEEYGIDGAAYMKRVGGRTQGESALVANPPA